MESNKSPNRNSDDIVNKLLEKRGLKTDTEKADFLNIDYEKLSSADLLNDIDLAVKRILQAMADNEKVAIYSDYDADGVPGAVLLADFFYKVGFDNFQVVIPHRHLDGYGFHGHLVKKLSAEKVALIITIDLGVGALEAVELANSLGVDVVITDHHEAGDRLPPAVAVVNPKLGNYPDKMICGTGVVFQLVRLIIKNLRNTTEESLKKYHHIVSGWPIGFEKWWLDLVGLATIADMVPLLKDNRIFAHYGLLVAKKSKRPGLHALFQAGDITQFHLTEKDIGFGVAPLINSASRLSHALQAYDLLVTRGVKQAKEQANELKKLNQKRKTMSATLVKQAYGILDKRNIKNVIVVGSPDWNPGLLSILAGKVMEEYQRTTFVWTLTEGNQVKGSARALAGESVLEIMSATSHKFIKFGGHKAAGGFTCDYDHIHDLGDCLDVAHKELYGKVSEVPKIELMFNFDLELDLESFDLELYKSIRKLSPFGLGNPEPIFIFSNCQVLEVRQFGKRNEHLEVSLQDKNNKRHKAVAFYKTLDQYHFVPKVLDKVKVVATISLNTWRGANELRLDLIDVLRCDE